MNEIDCFSVKVHYPVVWGDMDAMGHLNNTVYFRYFESARIRYFELIGMLDRMRESGIGPILAETSCRFIKPVKYPDNIVAGARVKGMGKSSIVYEKIVVSEKLGVAAKGSAVIVTFDYRKQEKTDIPDDLREKIEDFEKSFGNVCEEYE